MKMTFHAKTGPVFQFIQYIILGGFGLQSERIAGEVNAFLPVDDREVEFIPESFEGVVAVELPGKILTVLKMYHHLLTVNYELIYRCYYF